MFTISIKLGQDYRKSELGSPSCGRLSQLNLQSFLQQELRKGLFCLFFVNADAKFIIRDIAQQQVGQPIEKWLVEMR